MDKVIFITGATGLVGQNLIPRIMEAEPESNLLLLIRGKSNQDAEGRYNDLLDRLDSQTDRGLPRNQIQWIRGDICKRRLGLSGDLYEELVNRATHIIHAAADVRFNLPLEQARRVNLGGTKNIIALAEDLRSQGRLKQLAYIGTAFISGNRKGVIYENELDCGQGFSNTYEQSKFEAERYVRTYMDRLPITIFRPSIIVGDSRTGVTSAFNVIYKPLRLICKGLVRFLPGSRKTRLDIVPVDFVCDSLCHILFKRKESVGKIYHLTAGKCSCPSTGDIVRLCIKYINDLSTGADLRRIVFFPTFIHRLYKSHYPDKYKRICNALSEYEPYLTISRIFDNSNTMAALQNSNIAMPSFAQYYRNILAYCISSRWGKAVRCT